MLVRHIGIEQVVTAYRCPWQSPYVELIIGSIRRECLDYLIVLNERHLRRILTDYFDYYHHARDSTLESPAAYSSGGKGGAAERGRT